MHISIRMITIFFLYGFSSCTFLYEWLPFLFEWVFVMHISVRMTTISFWMDFRHAHFCKNDYHFFLNGFSSCTFLYEWLTFLFEWIVVMHISVKITTISLYRVFVICTECAWRKSIYNEMVVIRTEMCITKIHSKRNGSHSYRNVYDDNPFKKKL